MIVDKSHAAYFDESRVDGSYRFPVMAGFLAATEIWELFGRELGRKLDGRPKSTKSKKFLQQNPIVFSELIAKYNLQPIYASIEQSVINSIQDKDPEKSPLFYSAYTACGYLCCEILERFAEGIQFREPIKVICDDGAPHKELFKLGYEQYSREKKITYLEPTVAFGDEEKIMPLLAAHLYAWLVSKDRNESPKEADHEVNRSLYKIHVSTQPRQVVVTADAIRRQFGRGV